MTDLLTAALAAFVVELAKSAGHETGIRVLAALGPHLTAEQVGRAWTSLVAAAQRATAGDRAPLEAWAIEVAGEGYPDAAWGQNVEPGGPGGGG